MLVMTANTSQDFLAQMKCSVDVIALMPNLSRTTKSCQKQQGFTKVFLHCASKGRDRINLDLLDQLLEPTLALCAITCSQKILLSTQIFSYLGEVKCAC